MRRRDLYGTKTWTCPACGIVRRSAFCPKCGEQRLRPRDLSLGDLGAHFAKGFSSIDGKLLRSFRTILTAPGALTAAYVQGERRRFLGPLALFFIANALFVAVQSLTGTNPLSSPLDSHLHQQDWRELAQRLVAQQLAVRHQSLADYAPTFDRAAVFNAKALMILMVLALVPVVAAVFARRRRSAGAHVVFALHLYAFILPLLCISLLFAGAELWMGGLGLKSPAVDTLLSLLNLTACAAYIYLAIGPAYGAKGWARIGQAALLSIAVAALFVGYRFAIFLITLYGT